jgi:epoxyqueuosine reductase
MSCIDGMLNIDELTNYARSIGIDLFGIADISNVSNYVKNQGGEHVAEFPRAISLGVRLIDDVIDQLYNHQDIVTIASYRGVYDAANSTLDRAVLLVAKKIQEAGYRAYPISASSMLNNGKLEGVFSHKLAAHLAGLGWIGKNCLLVTPQYGPRLRLATVLTDAPLPVGKPVADNCGTCTRCADICPSKALTGVHFSPDEPRNKRVKAVKCDLYTSKRMEKFGNANCGLCVHICPWGEQRNTVTNRKNNSFKQALRD